MAPIWFLALALGVSACSAVVLEDLDEPQANDLVGVLAQLGVPAEKARAGRRFAVEVPRARQPAALALAHAAGFPRPRDTDRPTAGLVLTPAQAAEDARRRAAFDLGRVLRARPQVLDAQVVLNALGAAVVVRTLPGGQLDRRAMERLVRAGAGLPASAPVELQVLPLQPQTPVDAGPAAPRSLPAALVAALAALSLGLLLQLRRGRRR